MKSHQNGKKNVILSLIDGLIEGTLCLALHYRGTAQETTPSDDLL